MKEYRVRNIDYIRRKDGLSYDRAIFELGKRTPLAYIISRATERKVYTPDDQFIGKGKNNSGALSIFRLFGGHN